MTAEVAIMNRQAVVLAADSATTVSYWVEGKRTERYFKGANKLFELSRRQPVALMIFGSASVHNVPWEIVVKEFRRVLAHDSFPTLAEYGTKFADFVKSQSTLFPENLRKDSLLLIAQISAYQIVTRIQRDRLNAVGAPTTAEALETVANELATAKLPLCFSAPDIDAAVVAHVDAVEKVIVDNEILKPLGGNDLSRRLGELSIRNAITHFKDLMPETGIVIAGYGSDEFFPSLHSYMCYGFLDSHFLWLKGTTEHKVDAGDTAGFIEPFATTSMINTFQMGIGPDVFEKVTTTTTKTLRSFADALHAHWNVANPGLPIDALIERAAKDHQDGWFRPSMRTHYGPLSRVIGSLPVSDMAALAKSLIELESLKERVTEPSESVAGPTDVAVISKHDGFVWIERKHYFSRDLNPRFFSRSKIGDGS